MSTLKYVDAKALMQQLIRHYDLPMPKIRKYQPTDPCDYTTWNEIRMNIPAAKGCSLEFYVGHVFGHWLADLHAEDGVQCADRVANAVANLCIIKMKDKSFKE